MPHGSGEDAAGPWREATLSTRVQTAGLIATGEQGLAALQAYVSREGPSLDAEAALLLAEACEQIGNRYVSLCEQLLRRVFPPDPAPRSHGAT